MNIVLPCSTMHVFHYRRPDYSEPEWLDSILAKGLLPLSAMPDHPEHYVQLAEMPDRFRKRYAEHAEPALGNERLDPEWTVVTYIIEGVRVRSRLTREALVEAAEIWTADMLAKWLGAIQQKYFYYVPQVITFQPGGIPVGPDDIEPAVG